MAIVEVRRRENETVGGLLRRFTRKIQRSKVLVGARSRKFAQRKKSEYKVRKEALRRIGWQKEMARLRKLGKIE